MPRPLGLPIGSVRALTLLGLATRGVLDARAGRDFAPWLGAALLVCGASYFAARAARRGTVERTVASGSVPPKERDPLGLPGGTIRLLFLSAVAYGAWRFLQSHALDQPQRAAGLVLLGFVAGVLVRWFLTQVRRPEDASTLVFEHLQALASLVAAGGLAAMAVTGTAGTHPWIEPGLAAACTYYAGVR